MRNNKGITLIALVITIIVMLILVGVSVTVALNGGLFTRAKTAASGTEEERQKELALSNGDIVDQWVNGTASTATTENEQKVMHTITWNLTNISTEGLPTQIEDCKNLDVTLSAESGYYLPFASEKNEQRLFLTGRFGSPLPYDHNNTSDTYGGEYNCFTGRLYIPIVNSDITITLSASDKQPVVFGVENTYYSDYIDQYATYSGTNWTEGYTLFQCTDGALKYYMFYNLYGI